jgi:hypothetical protein
MSRNDKLMIKSGIYQSLKNKYLVILADHHFLISFQFPKNGLQRSCQLVKGSFYGLFR